MLDSTTKKRIDDARDILVGKIPDPKSQVEQITIALIYKFMDDMDVESEELGGKAKFFVDEYAKYSWRKIFNPTRGGQEILLDYGTAITRMSKNPALPPIFHTIFKQAYLPYNDPETLKSFLKLIDQFHYDHSEKLGDAFEYLLSVLGSQGDAGQFRTPRHIIDFMVDIVEPRKNETILDPACGTAGFLISAYKHILATNSSEGRKDGDLLTPDEWSSLSDNIVGYDISPDMVRLSLVNMYLHRLATPQISEYDTLTSDAKWNEYFDVVLANPPFMSPKGGIKPHSRFSIQSKRSEALFVDYIAEHLTHTGRGAVIVPEGVIFKSDAAFKKLRKMLVDECYLYGVISLPSGVFNPYSGVKTSILLFDKVIARNSTKLLFAKVENDGYALGAQRRPIEGSQLPAITATIKAYRTAVLDGTAFEAEGCMLVEKSKIAESGDYNLDQSRYVIKGTKVANCRVEKLGNLCSLQGGGTPSKSHPEYWGGKIKWISSKHIDNNGNIMGNDWITNEGLANSSTKVAPLDSVIFITRVSVGKYAYCNDVFAINQDLTSVSSLDINVLLPRYLYSISSIIAEIIDDNAVGMGVRGITKDFLSNIEIPLPSIEEQKAIVAEIESYQKIVDAARTIVDNYRLQITIDPDWEIMELGKIIKLSSGRGLTAKDIVDGEYPIYGGNGIINCHNDYFIENETIVIGRVGAYCGSVHIVPAKSWITDNGLYVTDYLTEINNAYLSHILRALNLNQYAKIGGQPSISQGTVYEQKIPLPSIVIQQQIVAEIEQEQKAVESAKELIEIFEQKIKNRIAKIWGE